MLLRYAFTAAAAIAVAGIAAAQAQSPFPPVGGAQQQQASPFPPVGGQQPSPFPPVGGQASPFPPVGGQQASPFPPAGGPAGVFPPVEGAGPTMGQQQQKPPCFDDLMSLKQEADKRFEAVRTAMPKRPTAAVACNLLTRFTQAEVAMIKFVAAKGPSCGLPPNTLDNLKASNAKAEEYRKNACTAAAQQQQQPGGRAAAPTLSDALTPPPPSGSNTRTGSGTLDSLGGNPLAR